jgi:hypothetical protein
MLPATHDLYKVQYRRLDDQALRNLPGLADVVDLGRKVQPPQCHAQQELHSSHDPIAVADVRPALDQVELK